MDITKINIVLNQMNRHKNYNNFINSFSFEECKYIFHNIESLANIYEVLCDENF